MVGWSAKPPSELWLRNPWEEAVMIAGYHLSWTSYGSWLPNDPRGSCSHEIRTPLLDELGELHHGRKKIQPVGSVIRAFYQRAKPLLKHPVYTFSEDEILLLAEAFARVIDQRCYTCYGC